MDPSELPRDATTYLLRLGVTLFFVAANGFFVAAEFALVKLRASRVDALAAGGSRRARVVQHLLEHLDYYLSACQVGITLASLILGWLAEPAVAELLLAGAHAVGWENALSPTVSHAVALVLALTMVTILHITVGEQVPKIWAIRRAETAALQVAYPLRAFSALFWPMIAALDWLSGTLLRGLGIEAGAHGDDPHDVEELRGILLASARSGHLSEHQLRLAENVLHMVDLEVRHILVPRIDVVTLSPQASLEETLRSLRESAHTRFPLCEGDLDSVLGVVHVKDLLTRTLDGSNVDLREIAHKPVFVPETQSLQQLISTMQKERSHCIFALDEHGSVVGAAFLEDALELVVGTIRDEFDEESPVSHRGADGAYRVPGSLSLPEAQTLLGLAGLDDSIDTIGGLVVAQLGRMPEQGDRIEVGSYRITVARVKGRRIEWLRIEPA